MGRRIGNITQQEGSYGDVDGLVEQFTTDNQVTFKRTSRDSLWLQYLAAFGDLDPARMDNLALAGKTEAEQIAAAKLHFETAGQFEAGRRSGMPFGLRYTRDNFTLTLDGRRIGTASGLLETVHPEAFTTDNNQTFIRRQATTDAGGSVYAYDLGEKEIELIADASDNIDGCGLQYQYVGDKRYTWNEARDEAIARGGRLAMFKTQQEMDGFNAYLDTIPGYGSGWVGYSDRDSEGAWKWADGQTGGVTNWFSGEPNNGGGVEDYANVIEAWGHKWNDWHDTDSGQASVGSYFFMEYGNRCKRYEYISADGTSLSWTSAKAAAEARGGRLAVVSSSADLTLLNNYLGTVNYGIGAWIGLRKVSGSWKWVDGTTLTTSNWASGQPDNHSSGGYGEEYVHTIRNYPGIPAHKWNDIDNNANYGPHFGSPRFGYIIEWS